MYAFMCVCSCVYALAIASCAGKYTLVHEVRLNPGETTPCHCTRGHSLRKAGHVTHISTCFLSSVG